MRLALLGLLFLASLTGLLKSPPVPLTNWAEYNGGPDRNHFSPLTQITPENVATLRVAWSYASGGADTVKNSTQMQCNPLSIGGILYGVSAGSQAFAIDATTGKEIWKTALNDDTFA
ncbi:MAG: PQQ-binding-like beta-propeller repeat protein, partial [Sphingobacteriaceae bacterium]|nr:PQQ-binding-like beta-propeller repeat protein [Cytophagaceae bacterium]